MKETAARLRLENFNPPGWSKEMDLASGVIRLLAPSVQQASNWAEGGRSLLRQWADTTGCRIELSGADASRRIIVEPTAPRIDAGSYGASAIAPDASYEAIQDFIQGKRREGLIVTVTSMVSDRCIFFNDLQVRDRGGAWTESNWASVDFKTLWRDSFELGNRNYYGELINGLKRDRHLSAFEYQIRRPSGALAEYQSSYWLVDRYISEPARVAISRVGDWRIIEGKE